MAFLKNVETGAVTENLSPESWEYQTLVKMRFQSETKIKGTGGFGAGSGGEWTAKPEVTPVWQEIAEQDNEFPDPAGGRVIVIALPKLAAGADESVDQMLFVPPYAGEKAKAFWVPAATIEKNATNYRTVKLWQWRAKEKVATETAAFEKTEIGKLESKATDIKGLQANALTMATEEFKPGTADGPNEPLMVENKHTAAGVADPGGVLYVVYTRV